MIRLLGDYIFDNHLRYEGHKMVYGYSETEEPIQIGGFFGAALLCVLLINSEEGERREIPMDIEDKQDPLFSRYEQEVIADDWGYLYAELNQLNDAYIQFSVSAVGLSDLCPNLRQQSMVMDMIVRYMQRLVSEEFKEHIWEAEPWKGPFAQWLLDAGYKETRRQRFLNTNWTDPIDVNALAEIPEEEMPTFLFEGEEAEEIIRRYWEWLWITAQKEAALFPDKSVKMAAFKATMLERETHHEDILPEMKPWMDKWTDFITRQLKPEKQINFWTKDVTEGQQETLLDYLKIQERQPQRYKCLAVAVYALRQLGYVTYNLAVPSMAKWLSERLQNDYSSKTGLYQFRRAWNELSRYHPAVQDEVQHLAEFGVKSIK